MIIPDKIYHIDYMRDKTYYTIIDGMMFYNVHAIDSTFIQVGDKINLLFENSCLSHNFSPFKFKEKYYAIGGQDNWKVDNKWRGIDYETFKDMYELHFSKEYIRGKEFYTDIKYKFDTTKTLTHNKGLYLLSSDNGIDWKFVIDDPIITVNSDGFCSSLSWKSTDFDDKPQLIKYKDNWMLYVRANIDKDRRHIQFTKSKDLLNWSKFQMLNIQFDIEIDNYYHPILFEHKRKLIGFFHYYSNEKSCIKIKKSEDGLNWIDIIEIFQELPFEIGEDKKKMRSHVCGVYKKDDLIYIYINHNYNSNDIYLYSYIMRYKMSEQDFNELL